MNSKNAKIHLETKKIYSLHVGVVLVF